MSYLWSDGSTAQTFVADAVVLGIGTHIIGVTVTDGICETTDEIIINVDYCSGLVVVKDVVDISVYPNPAKDVLNIMISSSNKEDVEFIIYDAIGQVVYRNKVVTENGNNLFNVDLSNKADGIYFIKFNNSVNNQLIRFVKSGN